MRVIGIDASLRSTGVGLLEVMGSRFRFIEAFSLSIPAARPVSFCLREIDRGLTEAVARFHPDAAAVEGIFHCRNVRTAVTLGEARGVAICACTRAGLSVHEYSPRKVKQSLVGHGNAEKEQVARMVVRLLGLPNLPQEDAADALAIAICHAHAQSRFAQLQNPPL